MKFKKFITLLLLTISIISFAQETNPNDTDAVRKNSINLFIDCNYCDIEHFKNEITFVNYVRDRKESDVHIIITEMTTGSGGTEYTISFYGHNKFDGFNDTLKFSLPANYTDDEERNAQIDMIKLGLVSYVAKTPMGKKISVVYKDANKKTNDEIVEDKWKSWVFDASLSGWMSGEETYSNYDIWSNIGISKITPEKKIEINYNNSYNESIYRFDWDTLTTIQRSNYGSFLYVKSLGEHWSVGGFSNLSSSTFSNKELALTVAPAIEYNLFKYSDATTKQLRFLYRAGYQYNKYIDTTIFNKIEEGLPYHNLSISFKYVKQWGTLESRISWSNYLNDFSKYNVGIRLGGSIKIFKGLSLRLWGNIYQKRDQVALRKGDASTEDILLQQREMSSQYNFWTNFGLSYTFGSIYNNVVNPRFDY